jgi:hypothetical protein
MNPGMQAVPFPGAGMNFSVGERGIQRRKERMKRDFLMR